MESSQNSSNNECKDHPLASNHSGAKIEWENLCKRCTLEQIKEIMEQGFDCNQTVNGETLLMLASKGGNSKLVEHLIQNGADVNAKKDSYKTALILACETGQADVVEVLLKNGATPDCEVLDGFHGIKLSKSALMVACEKAFLRCAKLLIQYGCDMYQYDNTGDTAMEKAVQNNQIQMVQFLLSKGYDLNYIKRLFSDYSSEDRSFDDYWLNTILIRHSALIIACYEGHEELVRILIDAGVELVERKEYENNCLSVAMEKIYTRWLDCVYENYEDVVDSEFQDHVENEQKRFENIILLLLDNGILEEEEDPSAKSLYLSQACEIGNENIVKKIIALVGKDHFKTAQDNDVIFDAARRGHVHILRILENAGADMNFFCKYTGVNVFIKAMENCHENCINYLLFNQGNRLVNGRLSEEQKVRFRTVSSDIAGNIPTDSFEIVMELDVFEWDWCSIHHLTSVCAAISIGISPGRILYNGRQVSLLYVTCLQSRCDLVRKILLKNFFYFEDLAEVYSHKDEVDISLVLQYFPQDQPLDLQTLAFLQISKILSFAGSLNSRKSKVDALNLPNLLKAKLKFE